MAQSGYTPIQLYYSTTAAAVPIAGNLTSGELAINITDGKLYYKNNSGTVTLLAGSGGGGPAAGSNTQLQFNSSGVFGASSSLTWDGSTLSTTGLTASSTVTLSGGTANGVTYLNGSKVLTSGSALTFDGTNFRITAANPFLYLQGTNGTGYTHSIYTSGVNADALQIDTKDFYENADTHIFRNSAKSSEYMRLTSTGLVLGSTSNLSSGKFSALADLSAVNGVVIRDSAVTYANNDNYVLLQNSVGSTAGGLTHPASQSLGVWGFDDLRFLQGSGATEQMRLTSTGLGIGTTSPSQKLQVVSTSGGTTARFSNTNTGNFIDFYETTTSTRLGYIGTTDGTNWTIHNDKNGYLNFDLNNAEQMRLTSTGLGIGTSSPSQKLHVYASTPTVFVEGTATSDSGVQTKTSLANFKFGAGVGSATNCWNVYDLTAGAERLRIDGSGNLGLGITAPSAKLDMAAGSGASVVAVRIRSASGNSNGFNIVTDSTTDNIYLNNFYNAAMLFGTNNTERMRLSAAGGLSIGTTTDAGAGGLNITGNAVLGDASTDTVTVNGYMGVGGVANAGRGIQVASTVLTGTAQYGVYSAATFNSAATATGASFVASPRTSAEAFTASFIAGLYATDATKGLGSTITSQYGLFIADQTQGTNNYGITAQVSSGTNKYNIYASGTANNYFAGNVGIGTSSPSALLDVRGNSGSDTGIISKNDGAGRAVIKIDAGGTSQSNISFLQSGVEKWRLISSGGTSFGLYDITASAYRWYVDSSGNIGLGVTPSSWGGLAGGGALQGYSFAIWSPSGTATSYFGTNMYQSAAATFRYVNTAPAVNYSQQSGAHAWFIAPSGTAGTAITFTQAMTLDASGNLGVGTSSPNNKLVVNGSSGTTNIQVSDSTASNNLILGVNTSTVDIKGLNGYPMVFYTANTERMRIDNVNGYVGIGTSSPSFKLDVVSASNAVNTIAVRNTDTSTANYSTQAYFRIDVAGNHIGGLKSTAKSLGGLSTQALYLTTAGAYPIAFGLNDSATPSMVLDTSGNLGIGTSSPNYSLTSYKGGAVANYIQVASGATGAGSGNGLLLGVDSSGNSVINAQGAGSGNMLFYTATTEKMRLDASGNLGLGVTPSAWSTPVKGIQITAGAGYSATTALVSGFDSSYLLNNTFYDGAFKYVGTNYATQYQQYQGQHRFYTAPSGTAGTAITFTQAMTLDANGNLMVGGTTASRKVTITDTATGGNIQGIRILGNAGNYYDVGRVSDTGDFTISGSQTGVPLMTWVQGGSERVRIDSSGNLLVNATSQFGGADCKLQGKNGSSAQAVSFLWNATTTGDANFVAFGTEASVTQRGSITYNRAGGLTVYNTTSDYRAKDIYGPVTDSGALIDSVPVYMGKMHGATQERPMFIAHETPAYAHTGEKDAVDVDGNPVYQQMDASALIPVMWAEIQSLRKRLADAGI